jgi:chemotaxis signal transduction protein
MMRPCVYWEMYGLPMFVLKEAAVEGRFSWRGSCAPVFDLQFDLGVETIKPPIISYFLKVRMQNTITVCRRPGADN